MQEQSLKSSKRFLGNSVHFRRQLSSLVFSWFVYVSIQPTNIKIKVKLLMKGWPLFKNNVMAMRKWFGKWMWGIVEKNQHIFVAVFVMVTPSIIVGWFLSPKYICSGSIELQLLIDWQRVIIYIEHYGTRKKLFIGESWEPPMHYMIMFSLFSFYCDY